MREWPRCITCNEAIRFDRKQRSENGKFIPLNLDGSRHDCPKSPYHAKKKKMVVDAS